MIIPAHHPEYTIGSTTALYENTLFPSYLFHKRTLTGGDKVSLEIKHSMDEGFPVIVPYHQEIFICFSHINIISISFHPERGLFD